MNKRIHDKPSKPVLTAYGFYGDCRNCGHVHVEQLSCEISISQVNGQPVPFERCPCNSWAPKDNLEFLQWRHEKNKEKK